MAGLMRRTFVLPLTARAVKKGSLELPFFVLSSVGLTWIKSAQWQ
jgi:hypothetical protein